MTVVEASERAPEPARRIELAGRRVLLLVRDPVAAARFAPVFELFGATVIPVYSAGELLAQLRAERPDAIAYDLELPAGGLHLIRRIRMRSRLDGGATPALAMTAALAPQMHVRALLAGFQAYAVAEPMEVVLSVAHMLGDRDAN